MLERFRTEIKILLNVFVILSPIHVSLRVKNYTAHNTESFSMGQSSSPDGGKKLQVAAGRALNSKWMSREIVSCYYAMCLLSPILYYHCSCKWLTNVYQFSLCFCSCKIILNSVSGSHLQYWIYMAKYTLEQQVFSVQYLCKKIIPINHVKESFTASLLVFKFSVGISLLRTTNIGAALIWGRLLKCTPSLSEDRCVMCHDCYKNSKSYTFWTDY